MRLPSYMIPAAIMIIEKMPLNESGKVDRTALAQRFQAATAGRPLAGQVPPRDDLERDLCLEFGWVLGFQVGIN